MSTSAQVTILGIDRVGELDVLRGFAALLMVFNHVGFTVLSPQAAMSGVSGAIVFVGSMAPVLFFFAAGVGCGLATRQATWQSISNKVLLLALADQFLGWSTGRTLVLDFFGFIAISMVVAHLVMCTKRPVAVAAVAAAAVLVVRFAVGKQLDAIVADFGVSRWILGVTALDAVSYPLAPWLVYPLLGVAVGVCFRRMSQTPYRTVWVAVAAVAVICAAAATWSGMHGGSLHRWGSVSAAFFALSIAVLIAAASLSFVLSHRAPKVAAALSLGGVASFVVVPAHYAIVRSGAMTASNGIGEYLAAAGVTTVLSFAFANWFERVTARVHASTRQGPMILTLTVILVAAPLSFALAHSETPAAAVLPFTFGQLALGLLFAWRIGPFTRGAELVR